MSYITTILESFLGETRKHNEETQQYSWDCPACSHEKGMPDGDLKGNLEINIEKGVFKCWVCKDTNDMSGSIIKLINKYGTKKNLREYKIFKPEAFKHTEKPYIELKLPEGFTPLTTANSKNFKYNTAIKYLRKRGITDDIIKKYNIGYTTRGTYFNRIIIPSYSYDDELQYFISRWFDEKYNKIKYLNPDVEKQLIIFNEGRINWDSTIYLVEGVFDSIVIPNSIPLLGKYISDLLFDEIYEKATGDIVIFFDGDASLDADILFKKLNFGKLQGRIKICSVPEPYDPSLIFQKWGQRGILKALKQIKK